MLAPLFPPILSSAVLAVEGCRWYLGLDFSRTYTVPGASTIRTPRVIPWVVWIRRVTVEYPWPWPPVGSLVSVPGKDKTNQRVSPRDTGIGLVVPHCINSWSRDPVSLIPISRVILCPIPPGIHGHACVRPLRARGALPYQGVFCSHPSSKVNPVTLPR